MDKRKVLLNIMGYYSAIKRNEVPTHYNMDGCWKHYAKWNKPDTKWQILYDSVYIKYQNRQIHRDRK